MLTSLVGCTDAYVYIHFSVINLRLVTKVGIEAGTINSKPNSQVISQTSSSKKSDCYSVFLSLHFIYFLLLIIYENKWN